ncbi:phage tail protein I [Stutzerimonas kunmingensis]|uniref:phage tail protein I n=1 Tax=Stutzerimonas kunmingensis TaxID=1211807 RepID=UPI00241DB848|nr:phage tail protein I [Stutzerimonas kunmingensis]
MNEPMLPPNATQLERALAETTAHLGSLPVPVRSVWNPQTCPVATLPWLAWALSVDDWNGLSEAQRRALIAASYRIHRRKGTVSAVREILNASNADVRLVEWWQTQPQGTPHTFTVEVEIEDRGITQGTLENIERQIVSVKPVRKGVGYKPSIHMPRWACRILLEITNVRVERLQDITEEQAEAEGVRACEHELDPNGNGYSATELLSILWSSLYGVDSYNANPWIWVVEFKRLEVADAR